MKIEFNKQLDKEVYLDFCNLVFGGADFGKKIQDNHPNITKGNYIKYIDDFYLSNKEELKNVLEDTELCFSEIRDSLFFELKKYFAQDYSNENFICYLSIFDCNPRYIENKSFQVFYKRSDVLRKKVIAHELTHFVFYDFCFSLGIKDDNDLWELSEIFNVIFLNLPIIQKVVGIEENLFYPDLKDKLEKVKEIWKKDQSAEIFIPVALEVIKKI